MEDEHLPSTRSEALLADSKYYFTGIPCKNGHLSKRWTKHAICLKCHNNYQKVYNKKTNYKHQKKYTRQYYYKNKVKINQSLSHKNAMLKYQTGWTLDLYDKKYKEQNGKCAICQVYKIKEGFGHLNRLNCDHCHQSLKTRGLLCVNCNSGLGYFHDNINELKRAIYYLENYKTNIIHHNTAYTRRNFKSIKHKIYISFSEIRWNWFLIEQELLYKQNYLCPIYSDLDNLDEEFEWVLDHDQKTNLVRGMLSENANIGLGHFKHDINIIQNAIKYLEKYHGTQDKPVTQAI